MKKSHITVSDHFCGAGGSSQAVRNLSKKYGGGIEVSVALNHWKLAIDTHSANFPDTYHECTDISASDPRRYPQTTGGIFSPECTTHSPAGGNNHKTLKTQMDMFNKNIIDPSTERSRATMWDVCRYTEYHKYEFIIVENVVEAKTRWVLFDDWLRAMGTLGYNHKCCYLNSMHFWPTPQSRDRMYVVFWKKGNKAPNLEYMPPAHCPECGKNVNAVQVFKNQKYGKYKTQYLYRCPVHGCIVEPYYYAAFNCIDWTDLGNRIGDRKNPLAPNTVKRINYGIDKYGNQPLILQTMYSDQARGVVRPSISQPAFAQTSFASQALYNPFIIDDKQSTGVNFRVRGADNTINTVLTAPRLKLVTMPFVVQAEQTSQGPKAKPIIEPLNTHNTRQTMGIVSHPFIIDGNFDPRTDRTISILDELHTRNTQQRDGIVFPMVIENQKNSFARSSTEPLNTQRTIGKNCILTTEAFNSFISAFYGGSHCTKHITEPTGAVTTTDRLAITNYYSPNIEDCYYRMLKAGEIKLAMAFDKDYIILGSGKDQVKQCGNAVTPPVMEWLTDQCVQSLN
jgi:DNA (cytosine-5)-methyltransferase 1